jgi:hypothetical protein
MLGNEPSTHLPPTEVLRAANDPIVAFYLGESPDSEGRRLDQIWGWNNRELEWTHDYIQWLFPLRERSQFNPGAPVLTIEAIDVFRKNEELRNRLTTSAQVMLKFYGLKSLVAADGSIEVSRAPDFNERRHEWLTAGNHNFLRLTRILKSLQILGLSHLAQALFASLDRIYREKPQEIGARTFAYWESAANSSDG